MLDILHYQGTLLSQRVAVLSSSGDLLLAVLYLTDFYVNTDCEVFHGYTVHQ